MGFRQVQVDTLIIGGGVAGLFTLAQLQHLGYSCLLLEKRTIGSEQTVHSQGIIHGGLKYALNGIMSNESKLMSNLPNLWANFLLGKSYVDLSKVKLLSPNQYIFTTSYAAKLAALFAQKAMQSQVVQISKNKWPQAFKHNKNCTSLYELNEQVIDVGSMLEAFATQYKDSIIDNLGDNLDLIENTGELQSIILPKKEIEIFAKKFIFTAGKGNREYLKYFNGVQMQLRPLHMACVSAKELPVIYAHCLGVSKQPRITITTHRTKDKMVWYIGGKVAEDHIGINQKQMQHIVQNELHEVFDGLHLKDAQFTSFHIERAEAKQSGLLKPEKHTLFQNKNCMLAWPTKLALAPVLAEDIARNIIKEFQPSTENELDFALEDKAQTIPSWA